MIGLIILAIVCVIGAWTGCLPLLLLAALVGALLMASRSEP